MGRPRMYGNTALCLADYAERIERPSPRLILAARLYASGAAPTKKAAAQLAGVSPVWMSMMTNHNPVVRSIMGELDRRIEDQSIEGSVLLKELGRKALSKMVQLMDGSANEHIQFKAAQDLADRSPEVSKIQRHEVDVTQISSGDAKALAAALVNGAAVKREFAAMAGGDYVRVDTEDKAPLPQGLAPTGEIVIDPRPIALEDGTHEAPPA